VRSEAADIRYAGNEAADPEIIEELKAMVPRGGIEFPHI
jgi:hypothetical protein